MNRGDVVLIDFPYSDQTGGKLRPALIVQEDSLNLTRDDTVLAAISRTQRFASTEVLIDIATGNGRQSGLRHTSVVDCALLATIDQSLVHTKIGALQVSHMNQVNDKLKSVLGLV